MTFLLEVEAGIACSVFLLCLPFFKSVPPTPPSKSAEAGTAEHRSVVVESIESLKDRDFLAVLAAFSLGQGTFNTLGTLVEQLVKPFGYNESDASTVGALNIVAGLLGAIVCGIILGYTHDFRRTLFGCFFGATFGVILLSCAVTFAWPRALIYIFSSFLGLTMTPVMPVAFEASVELMHPVVGEAVLSGLCMTGGQLVGIASTLVLSALLDAGHARIAWWLCAGLISMGQLAILPLRAKSVGARRRRAESLTRRSTATSLSGSPTLGCSA
jgi:MFS family permease